jgi:adenosylmethionine-8-amino-7-oxononanoate aminotransferase
MNTSKNEAIRQRDLAVLWHPTTQMKDHEWLQLLPVSSGKGVWLEDMEGKRYIDAISSWWVNLFGHANEHISAAISEQARCLEHVILAGVTHEPAVRLAEKLVAPSPDCFALPREQWDAHASHKLADLRKIFSRHEGEICAVIIEPLVQCAGGMRMYPPSYLAGLRALCD